MDVTNNIGDVAVVCYLLSFKIWNEKAALAGIHFIESFGIAIEKVAELLRYSFF